jgi:hypothetical protein
MYATAKVVEHEPWTGVIQKFANPPPGTPQFTDLAGNAVARPEGW